MTIHPTKNFSPDKFACPSAAESIVFSWVWNGELSREQIESELCDFAKAGIRSLYIIPEPKEFRPSSLRTYLEPDYMSDEYLDYYRFAFEKARSLGMELWLYDEGGWPSGGACGLTAKLLPDCGCKYIRPFELTLDGVYLPNKAALAAFSGKIRVKPGEPVHGNITEYRVAQNRGGLNFVDITRREVTETFIKTTHEPYKAKLGDLFGADSIPMLFTDEPNLIRFCWNDNLAADFSQRFGYDILDYLPAILADNGTSAPESDFGRTDAENRAVIDYKQLLGHYFAENFIKPCVNWCHENNLYFGGHLDQDHVLHGIIGGQNGSGLALLRLFDVPGIDAIWRQIFPGEKPVPEGYPFFPRFASSAAHQSGGELVLSESFAVYGDDITPDEMRYTINYQLARGVNIINFMNLPFGRKKALSVNMRPMATPEKPGFFSLESFYSSAARACYAMRCGKRRCDTALYIPVGDLSLGGRLARLAGDDFTRLGDQLERELIDFDLIDDEAILTAERTADGLKIGGACYRHIVIPDCKYMPPEVRKIAEAYPGKGQPLLSCDCGSIRVIARDCADESIYFVFNQGLSRIETELKIDIPDNKHAALLDTTSGRLYEFNGKAALESGDAAIILVTDRAFDARPECFEPTLLELEINALRKFVITPDGISSELLTCDRLPEKEISGDLRLRVKNQIEPGNYRLELSCPGLRAALFCDNKKLGDCSTTPQHIDFDYAGGELTLIVSNDPTPELHSKLPELTAAWEKAEYISYNERMVGLEAPERNPLILPRATLLCRK